MLSIDNLVLDLTTKRGWTDVEGALRSHFGSEAVTSRGSGRGAAIGGYESSWSVQVAGVGSFFLGIGPRFKGCIESTKGRIEFCPNKLMGDEHFAKFLNWMEGVTKSVDPVRFDLAHDFAVEQGCLLLIKNRKTLRAITSSTTTYHLGTHNMPGFYRQYDKAFESHLDEVLTRCEMTCDASWGYDAMRRHIPRVVQLIEPKFISSDAGHVNRATVLLATLLATHAFEGSDITAYLSELDYRTKAKVVDLICVRDLGLFPEHGFERILDQVRGWKK